jgi:hypothetical protein
MSEHKNVHAALAAVMADIDGFVAKKKSDQLNYSFASESDIIAAVRPAMTRHGVVVYPAGIRDMQMSVETVDKKGNDGKVFGTSTITRVTALFSFTFAHGASDSMFSVEVIGEGKDTSDKACNKAMTAAFKYALRQTLMIETGEGEPKPKQRPAQAPGAQKLDWDTRPKKADVLIPFLRRAISQEPLPNQHTEMNADRRQKLGMQLARVFGNIDENRHAFMEVVTGKDSITKLTVAEGSILYFWAKDVDAAQHEASDVLASLDDLRKKFAPTGS